MAEAFRQRYPEIELVLQRADGDETQRAEFLSHFARSGTSLGFAILGGVFGEGIDGFDFAYRYPGMTRVLQTAGRVIRTETDRGVLVLVDGRFVQPFYQRLYPPHWRVKRCYRLAQLSEGVEAFWAL